MRALCESAALRAFIEAAGMDPEADFDRLKTNVSG